MEVSHANSGSCAAHGFSMPNKYDNLIFPHLSGVLKLWAALLIGASIQLFHSFGSHECTSAAPYRLLLQQGFC